MAKTHKNLYPLITDFSNLLLAAKKAEKGKRQQENVAAFNFQLEHHLFELQTELIEQSYQPGDYTTFHIQDPKPRMISAAPYRDRVVHHALCNIIAPILEKAMIFDTYANREGKGTHKAILRYQAFSKKNKYVLKCDIRKFFPSLDHEILKNTLRKKISCPSTLWLIDTIVDNSNPQESHLIYFKNDTLFTPYERKRGLPIGNLTSQFFGNYYLSPLDHFVKEILRCRYYIRYVDDFVILDNDKERLKEVKNRIEAFLIDYRLIIHPNKSRVFQVQEGVTFLGFRLFPNFRLLKSENIRRFRKRLKGMERAYQNGEMTKEAFNRRTIGWFAHARFTDTHRLRTKIYQQIYG